MHCSLRNLRSTFLLADITRLWCVMEVFIFMRIKNVGSTAESAKLASQLIKIKLLDSNADLTRSLSRFDAARAECRYDRDRQKLLAVIEASFGTVAPFNQLVVSVLNARVLGLKEASRHSPASRRISGQAESIKANVDVQLQA